MAGQEEADKGRFSIVSTIPSDTPRLVGLSRVSMSDASSDLAPEFKAIGDCLQPRDIEMAVVEGHRVAIGL